MEKKNNYKADIEMMKNRCSVDMLQRQVERKIFFSLFFLMNVHNINLLRFFHFLNNIQGPEYREVIRSS